MTKRVWILFLFLSFLLSAGSAFAQRKSRKESFKENHSPFGRKKKEKKNQKVFKKRGGGLFARRSKSRGNANQFASNRMTGRKGLFASVFGPKPNRNASLRKTKPAKKNEDSRLYKKHRTTAKKNHRKTQEKQNRKRERSRKRGNVLFAKKKH